jgi:putative PIN family toxin of toxin-antitoxin system
MLWGGLPGRLIDEAIAGRIELVSSAALLAELRGVLQRERFAGQLTRRRVAVTDVFDGFAALVTLVAPATMSPTVLQDPADDFVLAAALSAQADLIVSGDAHLLNLKRFQGIDIVTAAAAVDRVAVRPRA